MGGRENQRRVVAAQRREPLPALGDQRPEGDHSICRGSPREQGRRQVGLGHRGLVVGDRGTRGIQAQSVAQLPEPHEQRQARVGRPFRLVEQALESRILEQQPDSGRLERHAEFEGDRRRQDQFAVCPREDGPGAIGREWPRDEAPNGVEAARSVGRQHQPPRSPVPCADALREALAVALDQPHRPFDHRRRATVIRDEVDAPQAGQVRRQPEDPPDVGEAPAIDGLVVIAHEEDPVVGRGEQEREPQLGPIHVLDLVHEQVRTRGAPPAQHVRPAPQHADGARDEVVEVQSARGTNGRLVRDEQRDVGIARRVRRQGIGLEAAIQLRTRHGVVEASQLRRPHVRSQPAQDPRAVHERLHGFARCAQDLAPKCVEGPHPDGRRRDAQRRQRGRQPHPQFVCRAPVEGDGTHGRRIRAGRDQPGDPGDERGGLPGTGGRDAEHGTGRGRGRGALVGRQPRQSRLDRWMEHVRHCRRPPLSATYRAADPPRSPR